jgi:hypothetical protein
VQKHFAAVGAAARAHDHAGWPEPATAVVGVAQCVDDVLAAIEVGLAWHASSLGGGSGSPEERQLGEAIAATVALLKEAGPDVHTPDRESAAVVVAPDLVAAAGRLSEKDAKLAQKLDQLQPFIAVFPQECMGQLASFGPT